MRIDDRQRRLIREAAQRFFNADVLLFGSRVDDARRGGDIDLYLETSLDDSEVARRRLQMLAHLHRHLGERKIDLVIDNGHQTLPIYAVARREGVRL
jgi:predicted nucleotidyltransferase